MRYFLTASIIFYLFIELDTSPPPGLNPSVVTSPFANATFPFSASEAPYASGYKGGKRSQTKVSGLAAASSMQSQL